MKDILITENKDDLFDKLTNLYQELYKSSLHTVLSLQETDAEHSAGFSKLKSIFEKNNEIGISRSMRDWTQFKSRKIPVEFLVPVEFINLLIKELKDCSNWFINGIVDDSFKEEWGVTEQEGKVFEKQWIQQNENLSGYIWIQLSDNKYVSIIYNC